MNFICFRSDGRPFIYHFSAGRVILLSGATSLAVDARRTSEIHAKCHSGSDAHSRLHEKDQKWCDLCTYGNIRISNDQRVSRNMASAFAKNRLCSTVFHKKASLHIDRKSLDWIESCFFQNSELPPRTIARCDNYPRSFRRSTGVPEGNVLTPILYALYKADIPTQFRSEVFKFVHGTVSLVTHSVLQTAIEILQEYPSEIEEWLLEKRINAITWYLHRANTMPRELPYTGQGFLEQTMSNILDYSLIPNLRWNTTENR